MKQLPCEPIMLHADRRLAACRGCDWRTPAPGATQATVERLYRDQHQAPTHQPTLWEAA